MLDGLVKSYEDVNGEMKQIKLPLPPSS